MDVAKFLEEVCALPGQSGFETPVASRIAQKFAKYSDRVQIDALGNVRAEMGSVGPTVLVCAHMDEVGMIVTGIEDNGFVRFWQIGGIDPRILPGSEVTVHGREDLFGVIGVKPPHLTEGAHKAARLDELAIDLGYPKEKVESLVRIGDPVSFRVPFTRLMNNRISFKTFDDRACVACMLVAMEELQNVSLGCRVVFTATVQEEVGSRGALTAANDVRPDMAVAFDVCHADMPGADPWDTMSIDKVSVGQGPTLHPAMQRRLMDAASALNVDVQVDISNRRTYTDADSIFLSNQGVPTALISLPLAYMHTTVETISERSAKEAGRLLAGFLKGIDEKWGEWLCF